MVGVPLVNTSSDDLWTDTDDESFVRATQCVMDAAANSFTSPVAVSRCTAVTSTPIIKSSQCRRTFCLDPALAVPCRVSMRPNHADPAATAFSSLPVAASSLFDDASFGEDLLVNLAEPDEVLDCQVKSTDACEPVEKCSPVSSNVTERCTSTTRGMQELLWDDLAIFTHSAITLLKWTDLDDIWSTLGTLLGAGHGGFWVQSAQ